jgi:hypothetical protein
MYQQQPSYTSSRCSNPYQGAVIPTRQGYCGNVVQSSCGSVQSHSSAIKPDHDTEALLKNGNITMKDGKIEFGAKIPSASVIEYNYVPKGMNVSSSTSSRDISQDTSFSSKISTGEYTISGENSKNDPTKKNIRVNISEGVGVFNIKINGQKYQIDRATVEKHFKNKEVAPPVPDEAKKERKNETAAKPDEAKSEAKETSPDKGFFGGLVDRALGRTKPMPTPSVEAPKPMPVPSVEPPKSEAANPMPVPSVEPPKPMPTPSVEAPKPMPVPSVEPPKSEAANPMPVPSVEPPKRETSTSIPAPKVEASASIPSPKVEVSNEAKEIVIKTNPVLNEAVRYRPKHTGYNDAGTFTPESLSYMTKTNTDGSISNFYVPKVTNVPSGVEAKSNIILEHNDKKGFREIKVEGPNAKLSAWSEASNSDMSMITSSYSHNYEKTRRIPSPKVETKLANISDLLKEVVNERPDYLGYNQGGKKFEPNAPYLTKELENGSVSSFYVPSVTSGRSKTILEFNTKEGFRALSVDGTIGDWSPTTIDQMPEIIKSYSDKKPRIPAPKIERRNTEDTKGSEYT